MASSAWDHRLRAPRVPGEDVALHAVVDDRTDSMSEGVKRVKIATQFHTAKA